MSKIEQEAIAFAMAELQCRTAKLAYHDAIKAFEKIVRVRFKPAAFNAQNDDPLCVSLRMATQPQYDAYIAARAVMHNAKKRLIRVCNQRIAEIEADSVIASLGKVLV